MKKHLLSLSAAALAFASFGSFADTATDNMSITVVVTAGCTSIVANDIDFGSTASIDDTIDIPTNVVVTCNNGQPYTVELDYGANPANATSTQRQVADADSGVFIDYDIFQPTAAGTAATTTAWGTVALGGATADFEGTGTGSAQTLVATGRLHMLAGKPAGTYTDLVIATLNF